LTESVLSNPIIWSIQSHFWHQLSSNRVIQTRFRLVIGFTELWQIRDYTLKFTITYTTVHSPIFTSRCSVTAFIGGCSPSSGFPNSHQPHLPASHSKSTWRLNLSSSLANSVTQQPTNSTQLSLTNCPAYNILERTMQKVTVLFCFAITVFMPVGVAIIVVSQCCCGNILIQRAIT
jgi:hypothetical protein